MDGPKLLKDVDEQEVEVEEEDGEEDEEEDEVLVHGRFPPTPTASACDLFRDESGRSWPRVPSVEVAAAVVWNASN